MKYLKRYFVFAIVLCSIFFVKFQFFRQDFARIEDFRGGELETTVWNPLVAADVNDREIKLVIDNKEYSSNDYQFYMNEDRNIMVPVSILRDALDCSAHVYDGVELLVEKHNLSVSFTLNNPVALSGEEEVPIASSLTKMDEEFYVSLNDLSNVLQYGWDFDIKKNIMTTADELSNVALLPSRYDLREKERVTTVRNQGSYGTCWASAALSAIESSLQPENNVSYSVDHMSMSNSSDVEQNDGGSYTMAMAYLAAWQGPVYEKDDPYGDGESDDTLKEVAHVQEMRVLDAKDFTEIKKSVFKYGGVSTSIFSTIRSGETSSTFYNKETNSYCYIGTEKPNHDVVIIGWDDSYPKENFNVPLEGDGAFICQNSWGENFGENGVFYVSYYDSNIGTHNVVYTRIEDVDNYDNIYQSDLCGWVGKMGYEKESIFGANVFTAKSNEELVATGFYATGPGTEYEVFVVNNFEDTSSFSDMKSVASGTLEHAGYYTIDFNEPVSVAKGERYAIVVYVYTPGATHPMAIEYKASGKIYDQVDLEDGEGYISYNGSKFTNVKEEKDCNLCIKAFSNNK